MVKWEKVLLLRILTTESDTLLLALSSNGAYALMFETILKKFRKIKIEDWNFNDFRTNLINYGPYFELLAILVVVIYVSLCVLRSSACW